MTAKLDARVAVEIFRWTPPVNKLPDASWQGSDSYRMSDGSHIPTCFYRADKWWQAPDGTYHEKPPAYSSEWAAVGELLAMLDAADWTITLCNQVAGKCWGATINTGSAHGTFPKAVCEAALKAKEARE